MSTTTTITYVTSSKFKFEETTLFQEHGVLDDGTPVKSLFSFEFRSVRIPETLEVNIEQMVRAEVREAYAQVRVPCIVEHAGLLFEHFKDDWYPGGLTKPMWNTLKDQFVQETASAGRRAIARAVIAYCDGMTTKIFSGDTHGTIADSPRGRRDFYWDTVFVPDDPKNPHNKKTYAEINDDPATGLAYKVMNLSQSIKAMQKLLAFLRTKPPTPLWPMP